MRAATAAGGTRGLTLAGGGVLWLAAGLAVGAGAAPVWIAADLLLLVGLVGLVGLGRLDLHGRSRAARLGLGTAVRRPRRLRRGRGPGRRPGRGERPAADRALLSAVGTTVYGVAVLSAGVWRGPGRFAPVACGAYPVAVMFPLAAASGGELSYPAIALWGATYAVLGAALLRQPSHR